MAPSAIDPPAQSTLQPAASPPTLYPAKEAQFERYIEPESNGYAKASSMGPGGAAIVIDNGI